MPFRALLDLVLPVTCAGCDTPGRGMCPGCAAALAGPARPVEPVPPPPGFPPCWAVAAYDGPARSALLAYKERSRADLLRPLAGALTAAVTAGASCQLAALRAPLDAHSPNGGSLVLVPVPSRPAAIRQRGADRTLGLARATAELLARAGIAARAVPALRLCRPTLD
ncbi:MAG: ComF family protein, partial [Actinomycetota bacterium]|nr:ComF family protein [Actinomycetota bacterium]